MKGANASTSRQRFHRRRCALAVGLALAGASPFATSAYPCGYHSPEDVALGALNWIFPKALYVRTAVWQAEDAGILPARTASPAPAIDLVAFHRISADLKNFGERMNGAGIADDHSPNIAIVLIDTVLWTRFARGAGGYAVEVHAKGPASGDVVLVSHGKVVQAIAARSITPRAALENGLIRTYGPPDNIAKADELLNRMSVPDQTTKATLFSGDD